jgi:hypothetical protein
MFQVMRHSGRSNTEFRVLLDTDNEQKAKALWKKRSDELRQGIVRLVKDGTIIYDSVAPRLRTRW